MIRRPPRSTRVRSSAASDVYKRQQEACAAVDSEGRVVLGRRDRNDRAAIRPAAENLLPWTLYVSGAPNPPGTGLPESQRYLLLGMGVMVMFLVAGTYFIARAIRREMEVSRMQSDFVSTVSHEFRSPLTSIRQLSEILELGRVPSEERRQVYYTCLLYTSPSPRDRTRS